MNIKRITAIAIIIGAASMTVGCASIKEHAAKVGPAMTAFSMTLSSGGKIPYEYAKRAAEKCAYGSCIAHDNPRTGSGYVGRTLVVRCKTTRGHYKTTTICDVE